MAFAEERRERRMRGAVEVRVGMCMVVLVVGGWATGEAVSVRDLGGNGRLQWLTMESDVLESR